jgi:hypothetical protein
MWISLCCGFLIFGLSACNLPGTGADDPEPTVTGGESQEVELGQQEQALKKVKCPTKETGYKLWYNHYAESNSGDIGEGSFHFEFKGQPPTFFYLLIEPSGKVTNKDLVNSVTINVSGLIETGSDDCPVQQLEGAWLLTADITGTCEDGIVTLKVVEYYEDSELVGSCDDPIDMPGRTSGPELTLTFNLSELAPMDGITTGSKGDMMYVDYSYQLDTKGLPPSELPIRRLPIPKTE